MMVMIILLLLLNFIKDTLVHSTKHKMNFQCLNVLMEVNSIQPKRKTITLVDELRVFHANSCFIFFYPVISLPYKKGRFNI